MATRTITFRKKSSDFSESKEIGGIFCYGKSLVILTTSPYFVLEQCIMLYLKVLVGAEVPFDLVPNHQVKPGIFIVDKVSGKTYQLIKKVGFDVSIEDVDDYSESRYDEYLHLATNLVKLLVLLGNISDIHPDERVITLEIVVTNVMYFFVNFTSIKNTMRFFQLLRDRCRGLSLDDPPDIEYDKIRQLSYIRGL